MAPEHTSDETLKVMRKPSFKHFHNFKKKNDDLNKKYGLNQELIPYFISSTPNCKEGDMGFRLEQVQDFTPTPMTVATVIYYSGYHPYTMKEMFTAKTEKDKKSQPIFFFWHKKECRKKSKRT